MGTAGTVAEPRRRTRLARLGAAAALVLLTPAAPLPTSRAAETPAVGAEVTLLVVGTRVVEVHNGTPAMQRLLRWAFDQFSSRGLSTPSVASVTFRNRDTCTGVTGWIAAGAVTVCFVHEEACLDQRCTDWRPWVKRTTVHELAHAWLAERLTAGQVETFLEESGLPTWSSDAWPWEDRGVELAAETIAWASLDQPARVNARMGNLACADLARYYRLLTGRSPDPLPTCAGHTEPRVSPQAGRRWVHTPALAPGPCAAVATGACPAPERRSADAADRSALAGAVGQVARERAPRGGEARSRD